MDTLAEIQAAVARLSSSERKALQLWLNSQADSELPANEEECLLRSFAEATRQIDAGLGVPLEEVRRPVRSWAAK